MKSCIIKSVLDGGINSVLFYIMTLLVFSIIRHNDPVLMLLLIIICAFAAASATVFWRLFPKTCSWKMKSLFCIISSVSFIVMLPAVAFTAPIKWINDAFGIVLLYMIMFWLAISLFVKLTIIIFGLHSVNK